MTPTISMLHTHATDLPQLLKNVEGYRKQVEDLLEYYMQRAATLQSESERLLAGARDLEESIGVSLSARRFEVGFSALLSEGNQSWATRRLSMQRRYVPASVAPRQCRWVQQEQHWGCMLHCPTSIRPIVVILHGRSRPTCCADERICCF